MLYDLEVAYYKGKVELIAYHFVHDDSIALCAIDAVTGEPIIRFTVCVLNSDIDVKKQVIVKNYSKNEGALEALIDAGLVTEPIRQIISDYELVDVCNLTEKGLQFVENSNTH